MAGFFSSCLGAFEACSAVVRGAVYGGLTPLFSSCCDDLPFDDLLVEVARGFALGALQGLLGDEEGGQELSQHEGGKEEMVGEVGAEEETEERVEVEQGLPGGEEEGEQASPAYTAEAADQQAASSGPSEAAPCPASAVPLVTCTPPSSHAHDQGVSGRAQDAPLEMSSLGLGLFSADAFAPPESTPPGFGVFSGPDFDLEALPTPSPRAAGPQSSSPHPAPLAETVALFEVLPGSDTVAAPALSPSEQHLLHSFYCDAEERVTSDDVSEGDGDQGEEGARVREEVGDCRSRRGGDTALTQQWLQPQGPATDAYAFLAAAGLEYFPDVSLERVLGRGGQGIVCLAKGFNPQGEYRFLAAKDIKPENILAVNGVAKLADFGLVTPVEEAAQGGDCGTHGYIAPEVYVELCHSSASDIFAAGVTLHNLLTGKRPCSEFPTVEALRSNFDEGLRYTWPDEIHPFGSDLVALVERCWHMLPDERPTAAALQKALHDIALNLSWLARATAAA